MQNNNKKPSAWGGNQISRQNKPSAWRKDATKESEIVKEAYKPLPQKAKPADVKESSAGINENNDTLDSSANETLDVETSSIANPLEENPPVQSAEIVATEESKIPENVKSNEVKVLSKKKKRILAVSLLSGVLLLAIGIVGFVFASQKNNQHTTPTETRAETLESAIESETEPITESEEETEKETETEVETELDVESEPSISDYPSQKSFDSWIDAYYDYVHNNTGTIEKISIIYVDVDTIPELLLLFGGPPTNTLVTFDGSKYIVKELGRSGRVNYLEHRGLLWASTGWMGIFTDLIYSVDNGTIEKVAVGHYYLDMNSNTYYNYTWNDEEVDTSTYNRNLNRSFDTNSCVSLENALDYSKSEFESYLLNLKKELSTPKTYYEMEVTPYKVIVNVSDLNIRSGPGTNYDCIGSITDYGVYTIIAEATGEGSVFGWGKLKSGAGWISLDYVYSYEADFFPGGILDDGVDPNYFISQSDNSLGNTHNWIEATCTIPKTCIDCGETLGEALGHSCTIGVCYRCGQSFYPTIVLPLLPIETSSSIARMKITSLSYEFDASCNLILSFVYEKTKDIGGEGSKNTVSFNYKLLDENGIVVVTDNYYQYGLVVGDKAYGTVKIYNVKANFDLQTYSLEISDNKYF